MLFLWILMIVIGLCSYAYVQYELFISPIPSNDAPLIRKDILFVFAIFFLVLIVLFNGITGLCDYLAGPEVMRGFLGTMVGMGVIFLLSFIALLLQKKYKKQLFLKKRASTEMRRLSENKALYYCFFTSIILNYLLCLLLHYAQRNSLILLLGIYIFQICSLLALIFLLFHHRYIRNKVNV